MDAGIQDISTSISIEFKVKYVNDLAERYESDDDDDESDKHLEARDRKYSCLILQIKSSDRSEVTYFKYLIKISFYRETFLSLNS